MKRVTTGLLGLGLLLSGCGSEDGSNNIVIGGLVSQTGDQSYTFSVHTQAMQLAVEEINRAGGVLGRQLSLSVKDDATGNLSAISAQALVDEGVPVVIGAPSSVSTLNAAAVLSPAHVVQISQSSTSPAITTFADDGYLFRTCASDAFQGKLLAQRAYARGQRRVAGLTIPGAYGEGLSQAFQDTFNALGGQASFEVITEGKSSYQTELTQIFAASPGPDAILLVAFPADAAQIIKDYNAYFLPDHPVYWLFNDSETSPDLVPAVGSNGFTFGHEGTAPAKPSGERFNTFLQAYIQRFGGEPTDVYAAHVYDAVYLSALAMEAAGEASGTGVRDHLGAVSAGGTSYSATAFQDAVAAIHRGEDVDYAGASGPVDLDASGDITSESARYDIWKVVSDAITTVESDVAP